MVLNIKACIPITLDYADTQYNNWSTLFQLHCRANLVIDHILPPPVDPSAKPSEPTDAEKAFWQRLDDIAVDAWKRLKKFFHNNKSARALQLDAQFTNTKLEQFEGVKPYCTRLKTLVNSLRNVGDTVSDNRMVLQLLKGLSEEYKPFRTSVRHLNPLPSFDALPSMLELEEQRNATDLQSESNEEALLVQSSSTSNNNVENFPNSGGNRGNNSQTGGRKNNKVKGTGKGKGSGSSGGGSGGRSNQSQPQQQRGSPTPKQQQQMQP
ncbi:DEP domain-containing protein DDB_G0279099-like [Chenopodium quinoa]|uniref:DEP domain-containing protein DDB_G0279099-like n=1 Tax=Chenopodium quinoa TaxID=63459 RepID=UPI000B78D45A|nr:DEP domain-containing protein DDB_G0279099-like [Chenopodium quinoa]